MKRLDVTSQSQSQSQSGSQSQSASLSRGLRVLSLGSIALLAACTAATEGGGENVQTNVSDLKLPSFVATQAEPVNCGSVARGTFAAGQGGHGFAVTVEAGKRVHFEFASETMERVPSTIALFDAKTNKRIAFARGRGGRLDLDFEPDQTSDYLVAAYANSGVATGDYRLKEFCTIAGQNALADGQTVYENEELVQRFRRGIAFNAAGGAEGAVPPSGRSNPVEEADIYKVDGNRFYYLNTYRGFLVYDIANTHAPKELARLPVYGYPVEMFVQNNVVYALLRDVLEVRTSGDTLRFEKTSTSQLVAIDISNPAAPKLLQKLDVKGDLREGLSRKVGDTIYVVSQQYGYSWSANPEEASEQAWVYSFDVKNPASMTLVQQMKIFEGGNAHANNQGSSSSRWFQGVTISATSNALMVVENWSTYSYVYGSNYQCGTSSSQQQAVVSIVDISDPSGQIGLHTKFETYGRLGDQFKQTYEYDPIAKKAYYHGVFARQEWASQDCKGQSHVENAFETWDVTDGAQPKQVSRLNFGKPDELVRGSAYDTDRHVLYAITARAVDPLYAISFADPTAPKILSAVDGLSGDMNLFRFIGDNRFLLAIGRDPSEGCTGFGSPQTGWATQVAASIIDVRDASKVRLVQRKCVTINDASWVGSDVNWNLDQAHKMIGLSEGTTNIVSIPVDYTRKIPGASGWNSWRSETAVGLLTWDLTKYDPTKPPEAQNVLENAATVVHPAGAVKRSVIVDQQGITTQRKLINLSSTHMSIVDIENVKKPEVDSVVEIAPYKDRAFTFGGYVVEQVQPFNESSWSSNGLTEFRVKAAGPNVDDSPALTTFSVPSVERAVKFSEDKLVVFQRKDTSTPEHWSSELHALVVDMAQPTAPRTAGTVKLPVDYVAFPRYAAGASYWYPYWGDASDMAQSSNGLVFLTSTWTENTVQRKLVALNVTNADAPTVSEVPLVADDDVQMVSLVADEDANGAPGDVVLSYRKKVGDVTREGTKFDVVKYFAQTFAWTNGTLEAGAAVNVPGKVAKSFVQSGQHLALTVGSLADVQKGGDFLESPRLELVETKNGFAELQSVTTLWGRELRDLVASEGRVTTNLAERSTRYWLPMNNGTWVPPMNELRIFTVSPTQLKERFAQSLGTSYVELMGVHDQNLFLSLPGDGVLVVDATNPAAPQARQFVRTLGWSWSIAFAGNDALIPAGFYGTYQVSLGASDVGLPLH